ADVVADSLSFDGLKGSFPSLPLRGAVAGPVRLAGPLDSLETHAELHGPGGAVHGDGLLMLDLPHYGARDLKVLVRDVNLKRWVDAAPISRLNVTLAGTVEGDSVTFSRDKIGRAHV